MCYVGSFRYTFNRSHFTCNIEITFPLRYSWNHPWMVHYWQKFPDTKTDTISRAQTFTLKEEALNKAPKTTLAREETSLDLEPELDIVVRKRLHERQIGQFLENLRQRSPRQHALLRRCHNSSASGHSKRVVLCSAFFSSSPFCEKRER